MKPQFNTPFRKYGAAAMAAMSLMAFSCVTPSRAEDDKDHKKEEHGKSEKGKGESRKDEHATKEKSDHVAHKDTVHKDSVAHKDTVHKDTVHKDVAHKDDVVHKGDSHHAVVDKGHSDHFVHGAHAVHASGPVHRHSGWVLHQGNGWQGQGWYYGPPGLSFFAEGPDVMFFASRDDVPVEYVDADTAAPDTTPTTPAAESPDAAVQQALLDKGYYKGAVDGQLGPMSHRAIARYQKDNGMPPTGLVTDELLSSLGIH